MDFSPLTLAPAQWQALQDSYATPPRAYHHFGHVRAVLQHCQEVADGPGWKQPAEIYLAVLYHDAIYQAGRKDNEARSAQLALQAPVILHHQQPSPLFAHPTSLFLSPGPRPPRPAAGGW